MSEETPEATSETEQVVEYKPAEPILIDKHDGEFVRLFEGKLPAINMVMEEGYVRNTHLKLMVEVRVRGSNYVEQKNGELIRQHTFALEGVELVGAYSPEQLDPGVGGSASAAAMRDETLGITDLTESDWNASPPLEVETEPAPPEGFDW